jgi:micrococcal nuclease
LGWPAVASELQVPATVVKIYDGDTLTVDARPWPGNTIRTSVRVRGIDTPEIRGKCEGEKALARTARDRARELVGEEVLLIAPTRGKYAGRVVADVVTAGGIDLGQALVAEGLAREYDGGKRAAWCENNG